jgi:hypothetical protein
VGVHVVEGFKLGTHGVLSFLDGNPSAGGA